MAKITKEIKEKFKKFLLKREKPKSYHALGNHELLQTDKRVILTRKFPLGLYIFKPHDVEEIEYTTDISWISLLMSFFALALGYAFLDLSDYYLTRFLGGEVVLGIFAGAFIVLGVVALYRFVDTLQGRLRISLRYYKRPIVIHTRFSEELNRFVKEIERK